MDRPLPWLKYVDAGDLDDDRVDFDGLNVESPTGEHLGGVDGFIVDVENGRPYYVVVDAGGWFKSKDYLLPIGQARLDIQREVLVADLTRDRIEAFPGFDLDEFDTLSADDIRQFNDETSRALSGNTRTYSDSEHFSTAWSRPEFRHPDWWPARAIGDAAIAASPLTSGTAYPDAPTMADLTRPVDRSADLRAADTTAVVVGRADVEPVRDRASRGGVDPSPHHDGRAQPGDVLGLETGGERTHVGETAEDEDDRRRDAEQDAAKRRE